MNNAAASALRTIVGRDPSLLAVLGRAERIAPSRIPVLVTGESGTGKELLARALHDLGPTPRGPFVAVNCGALSRELAESELFGHERGAFTGAAGRRAGWFEEANGGTLVLDEVGELPVDLQPKLLRALETGRIRRVGGSGEIAVSVRVVAMTLRDLRREAHRGAFRLDLYHRLAGFVLALPPLRQRPLDVPLLVEHFLRELVPEVGSKVVSPSALARLQRHDWPGNIRELRNVLRRAAFLATGPCLDDDVIEIEPAACEVRLAQHAADEPRGLDLEKGPPHLGPFHATVLARPAGAADGDVIHLSGRSFDDLEKEILSWALRRHRWSRRQAARALGISRSTFCDRVKRLGLVPEPLAAEGEPACQEPHAAASPAA